MRLGSSNLFSECFYFGVGEVGDFHDAFVGVTSSKAFGGDF